MTAEGMILYANRRFAEMLKMPLEKVIGAMIHSWIAPDSQRLLQSLLSKGADEKRRGQLDLITSGGTAVPVLLSLSNVHSNDMPDFFCLVATDLTEQKRSEAIIVSAKSTQELLAAAYQSRRELLSLLEDQKRVEDDMRKLNSELEQKVIARTADLEQARLESEQANQAKSAFLAAMSHEIRTPMNGVVGMVDVLQQSSLNPQQMEMSNIIHDSAYALLAVVDDILDFSKIEAGKLQVESVPMNIAEVVEGACDSLDHVALKKAVELTMFADPSLPAQVMGDPGRLRQILINLTNNAIKFSSGQGKQARVSVHASQEASSAPESMATTEKVMVEFSVSDNGIGIDAETQARLFTPFTQADSSTTRNFGGSGLGLAISRQLVDMMGGKISVQSEAGKGAVFTIHLSFALPPKKEEADEMPSPVAGLCCLVVGSTDTLAGDMTVYLAHDGALVEQAKDLDAARQWIAMRPPGLCVVVIDTVGARSPPDISLLDGLRTAAHAKSGVDIRFLVLGRGKRRKGRLEAADQVFMDAAVMHRKAFIEAVAIAAGRVKAQDMGHLPGVTVAAITPLSREEARTQGRLILIAEDNEINQKVIQQQLKLLGQTADLASNGREALERWQSSDYSVLLTDLHMPEMDGYELTAAIRAVESGQIGKNRTAIIAFTANALKGEAEHCRAVGMNDYLSKPVQLINLKAMLEKWLPIAVESSPAEAYTHSFDRSRMATASPDSTTSQSTKPANGQVAGYADEGKNNQTQGVLLPQHAQAIAASLPVDINVLKKLVGDDEATIREFLHEFRLSAARIAEELRTACATGNSARVAAAAHKLKSSARAVGALESGELCAKMEQFGKTGNTKALTALLPSLEQELANVEHFLEGY